MRPIGGFILTFILGAAASTAAVWKVVSTADSPDQTFQLLGQPRSVNLYRHANIPSVIATLCILLMMSATLVFGWLAASSLPAWFHGNNGLLLMNTTLSFAITVLIMASSTALASIAMLRAYPS